MKCMEQLSEEEKRALRGSKFAPLPAPSLPPTSRPQPRLAHPGGPLKTNKAAALAKFLERKLQEDPVGLATIHPDVLQLAVQNAKASVLGGTSVSGTMVRHSDSFDEYKGCCEEKNLNICEPEKQKKKKNKKKIVVMNGEKMMMKKKKKKKKNKKQKVDCF